MRLIRSTLLSMALVGVACSSGGSTQTEPSTSATSERSPSEDTEGELKGCVPACVRGFSTPGDLPEGEYQTMWFFGGEMKLTFQGRWTSGEDSTGEFRISPTETPADWVLFWEDVYPVESGKRVQGVQVTAAGLLDWLMTSSNLDLSKPTDGSIGEDLPATIVDVRIAEDAVNDDPQCPVATCVNFLSFPQWDGNWGIAGNQVQRFYLSEVSYGGVSHLFVAVVYPFGRDSLDTFLPPAEELIASVRVPATAA